MQEHHRQVVLGVLWNARVLVVNNGPILVNRSERHVSWLLEARGVIRRGNEAHAIYDHRWPLAFGIIATMLGLCREAVVS